MNKVACYLAFVATGVPCFALQAAPGSEDANSQAKISLVTLKNKLPQLVADWSKRDFPMLSPAQLRSAKQFGSADAKITLVLCHLDSNASNLPQTDQVIVIFLKHYGDSWTTIRYESSGSGIKELDIRTLMLDIDELDTKEVGAAGK
jgi:hypothetical protein